MSDVPDNMNPETGGLTPPAQPDPLAEALADLEPAPPELNRDRLMFAAGAESRRPVVRLWQATAGFMVAVGYAAGMYFPLSPKAAPTPPERVVYVDRLVPAPASAEPPAPAPAPTPEPTAAPSAEPDHQLTSVPSALPYFYQPEEGGPAHWFRLRNDILTAGLGLLPDSGRRFDMPGTK
jgi:hypothetical protein